jgi:hypothetical protein
VEDRERRSPAQSDENEDKSGEDVELHRRSSVANTESPAEEGQSDDDVELHRRSVQ